jgi:hypothetical protein
VKKVCENKRFYEWTEELVEFEGCRWKDIRSSDSGGALCIDDEEGLSVSIDDCSFMNISTSGEYGGSIECYSCSSFILTSSLFFDTSAEMIGGCDFDGLSTCLLLHNNSFEKCFASDGYGGCLYMRFLSISDIPCSDLSSFGVFFGCLLKQCQSVNEEFAGLWVINPPSSFSVRSCVVEECKAGFFGGGIYFQTLYYTLSTDILLYYCFFQ